MRVYVTCIAVFLGVADNYLYWGISLVKVAIEQRVAVNFLVGSLPNEVLP